ncbi:hypothetical protein Daus18300_002479 [Diaporthe australafricana]|uniref:Methyltransferase domain-containing protein n=1 Tax=Diaporthe australafricana TaxID=127596 RepID=A0ABR3XPH3_9PEZI
MADTTTPRGVLFTHQQELVKLPKPMEDLLLSYSHIAAEDQLSHVISLRDEAYKHCPYPCIGRLHFLDFNLAAHPGYEERVLAPLRKPRGELRDGEPEPLLLDIGTCFGQDVRKLVADGVPPERLWASEIEQFLLDLSFRLFKDDDRLKRNQFLSPGDVLAAGDDAGDRLGGLNGRVTMLHLRAVFHLFTWEQQKRVANRCLQLLRKDPGVPFLIVGGQVGDLEAGPYVVANLPPEFANVWRHNEESWLKLWQEVAAEEQWRGRIAKLDVWSKLMRRTWDSEGAATYADDHELAPDAPLWHVSEVCITFK